MKTNPPTPKQMQALRNFKVPEGDESYTDFQKASRKLDELIKGIKPHASSNDQSKYEAPAGPSPPKNTPPVADFDIEANLRYAKALIESTFPDADYSLYGNLIAECMHERFSLYITKRIQRNKMRNIEAIK